ncbi:MAG: energy-coupling factor transporter transmembrane protein EcfT [Clostridia bacterium]|nr:energy-coupling factor transporter transmembrane protein EcfT [Clostridia bacterium]
MQKNEFKTYHPVVNFIYFVLIIGFSCVFMHPISLCISLFSALIYSSVLKVNLRIKYILPMFIGMAILNPIFSHGGVTILSYLPSGNPLTLEAIIYGIAASAMLISIICWFFCYNEVMTSDKFIYLFGRVIPSLSLVLSMTLRFVPRFIEQMKKISQAQKAIGKGVGEGNYINRIKNGISVISVMITWSFENAIDTADSMKSRGYGTKGRTSFSIFKFDKRDIKALTVIVILGLYIIVGGIFDGMYVKYFPSIRYDISVYSLSVFLAYLIFCLIPLIIEMWEVIKWKYIISKI